jgi:hypothetical protein
MLGVADREMLRPVEPSGMPKTRLAAPACTGRLAPRRERGRPAAAGRQDDYPRRIVNWEGKAGSWKRERKSRGPPQMSAVVAQAGLSPVPGRRCGCLRRKRCA